MGGTTPSEADDFFAPSTMADSSPSHTLVIGLLTIESSVEPDVERPATGPPDTVQFWIAPDRRWKLRTYAIEFGLQFWDLGPLAADPVAFAKDHIARNYGDVLARVVTVDLPGGTDPHSAQAPLAASGLGGSLVALDGGDGATLALWLPHGAVFADADD